MPIIRHAMLVALVVIVPCAPIAAGAETKAPAEAVAMVKRVAEKLRTDGPEATFKAVLDKSTPEYHDGDLYPFILDMNGVMMATGSRTQLVGMSLASVKDQDGRYLIQEMIAIARSPGSGWVEYKWPNPQSKRIEGKLTYIEKVGDYVVAAGVWKH